MKLNWKAIIVGFAVAFVIALLSGLYSPKLSLIGPIIGGFIAVYMVEVSYTNGILYGGIPASIAGLISSPLILFLKRNQINVQLDNVDISPEALTSILYISGTILGFFLFFFMGVIFGTIAVAVRKKTNKKWVYVLVPAFVVIILFILSEVVKIGAVLTTYGPA